MGGGQWNPSTLRGGTKSDGLRYAPPILRLLDIDWANCRPFVETYSWRVCAERFMDNLVPVRVVA
jgi:hypothetical protein